MLFSLFSFLTGFLLILLVVILLTNKKKDRKINLFFLLLLTIAGSQRFLYGFESLNLLSVSNSPFQINLKLTFFLPPLYYAFFLTLLYKSPKLKMLLLPFGVATIIVLALYTVDFSRDVKQIVYLIYSSTYVLLILKMNRNYVFAKKTILDLKHIKYIKSWVFIMLGMLLVVYVFSNYIFSTYIYDIDTIVLKNFYISTSALWFLIALYILMNPIILYGEQLLHNELITKSINEIEVWNKNKLKAIDKSDKKVEKKIAPSLNTLQSALIQNELNLMLNFKKVPTLKELSFELGYPQSHIKFLFKYYSYYSFGEYVNVLKIKYALHLIHTQYLQNHTIDSLSTKCFFTNRSTFFKNFKKLTGSSPSNYIIKHSQP